MMPDHLPEPQAASPGPRTEVSGKTLKSKQSPSQKGSRRLASSHTWWSTTLLHHNRHFVITNSCLLLHIMAYLRALAWSHSRTRRRRTWAQQALPVHQYYSLYDGALRLRSKYVHTLLDISSNSSIAASERFFFLVENEQTSYCIL